MCILSTGRVSAVSSTADLDPRDISGWIGSLCKVINYVKRGMLTRAVPGIEANGFFTWLLGLRRGRRASGGRQMAVEKRRDPVFIEGLDLESAPVHPAPEGGRPPEIGRSGLTCVVRTHQGSVRRRQRRIPTGCDAAGASVGREVAVQGSSRSPKGAHASQSTAELCEVRSPVTSENTCSHSCLRRRRCHALHSW